MYLEAQMWRGDFLFFLNLLKNTWGGGDSRAGGVCETIRVMPECYLLPEQLNLDVAICSLQLNMIEVHLGKANPV